jgi:phage shock protein PspC (stress-responsive transcriptional regulator)
MDLTAQLPPSIPVTDAVQTPEFRPLRRSPTKKMLAGVAGGVAERFEVDANLVRVAFVVLTCLWGLGAAIYLSMWALVPVSGATSSLATTDGERLEPSETVHASFLTIVLLAGALATGLIFSTPWWGGPRWGGGIGLAWVIFLAVLLVFSLRGPARKLSFRRVIAVALVGVISLVIVASGAFLGLVAMTGVPMRGGIGVRVWQPTSVMQLNATYRTAIGNTTVDLRHVDFTTGTYHLTASVAVGQLVVDVPANVVVDVTAHSGIGNVVYENENGSQQFFERPTTTSGAGARNSAPVLVLVADAGVGQVQLYRAA